MMKSYPLDRLVWVNDFINLTTKLPKGLNPKVELMLHRWPPFDLLQMDNRLLKVASLLLVKGATIADLVSKARCDSTIILGFINACHRGGYLSEKTADFEEVEVEVVHDSMFTKLKEAFSISFNPDR